MFTAILLSLILPSAIALEKEAYVFQYEDGSRYAVSFSDHEVTWKGLEGIDRGRIETDPYLMMEVDPGIRFIQWTERDETFVTLVMNLNTLTVHSSGIAEGVTWLRKGTISVK